MVRFGREESEGISPTTVPTSRVCRNKLPSNGLVLTRNGNDTGEAGGCVAGGCVRTSVTKSGVAKSPQTSNSTAKLSMSSLGRLHSMDMTPPCSSTIRRAALRPVCANISSLISLGSYTLDEFPHNTENLIVDFFDCDSLALRHFAMSVQFPSLALSTPKEVITDVAWRIRKLSPSSRPGMRSSTAMSSSVLLLDAWSRKPSAISVTRCLKLKGLLSRALEPFSIS